MVYYNFIVIPISQPTRFFFIAQAKSERFLSPPQGRGALASVFLRFPPPPEMVFVGNLWGLVKLSCW